MLKDLIEEMPCEPHDAFLYVQNYYISSEKDFSAIELLQIMHLLNQFYTDTTNLRVKLDRLDPSSTTSIRNIISEIINAALPRISQIMVQKALEEKLEGSWLTKKQLSEVQLKINELRDIVNTSELFDNNHKNRLLKIIEKLQREINQPVPNYDLALAGTIRLARTLGKSGQEIKPLTDRIKDLFGIFSQADSGILRLPSGEE